MYMNRFLKHWRLTGRGEAFRAHVISYADDFVILSRGHAAEALAWTRTVMARLGLTLNEAKTSVRDARTERFDFLGYTFGPHCYRKDGHWYLGASPSGWLQTALCRQAQSPDPSERRTEAPRPICDVNPNREYHSPDARCREMKVSPAGIVAAPGRAYSLSRTPTATQSRRR